MTFLHGHISSGATEDNHGRGDLTVLSPDCRRPPGPLITYRHRLSGGLTFLLRMAESIFRRGMRQRGFVSPNNPL